jgi:prepilin-type N-terminal cleavage/methylation domain-containing protein
MMRFRTKPGFTLVELLVVMVIVGILAAISVVSFGSTKMKANFAAMRSDLHQLSMQQEGFFYEHRAYSADLDSLKVVLSRNVQVVIHEATPTGWSATATHPESYPHHSSIFYGGAAVVAPATQDGVVACQ